jgi:uncharacterized Zn finger protein
MPRRTKAKTSALTWDSLSDWAGSRSVSRGRAYQRQGRVQKLARTEDGRLLATVSGSEKYITSAWLTATRGKRHRVDSVCTCPIGASGCKHAVAVVADYLAAIVEKRDVPVAEPEDRRWAMLEQDADLGEDFEDEDFEDEDDSEDWDQDDFDDELCSPSRSRARSPKTRGPKDQRLTRADWDQKIKAHLEQKSQEDLTAVVWSLIERFPELRQEFQERIALSEGDVDRLVAMTRRELRSVTAEFGWRNHWNGDGHTPDFSGLRHRLERLAEMGHYDQVTELGREIISRGMDQVGQADDEGETAMGLADCLEVVFKAAGKSSLAVPDKLLYAIDAQLQDNYDLIGTTTDVILRGKWIAADWSVVADRLKKRLEQASRGTKRDDFTRDYQRDRLSGHLLNALQRAGRPGEILAIYEAEARETGSYQRLVNYLLQEKQYDAAEHWAREGIAETRRKYPGLASALAESLCELARRAKKWDVVAAHAAVKFFLHPSSRSFDELVAAAKRTNCDKPVRATALKLLETGALPIRISGKGKPSGRVAIDPTWPLPLPDYLVPMMSDLLGSQTSRPHYDVLLDMAINAKQPDEILRWYDAMLPPKTRKHGGPHFVRDYFDADRVAKAIATKYPQRALEIYRDKLDAQLRQTGTSAYENCAASLRKMRPIYKSLDQDDHWNELLADIRHQYKNRPRFMEILDQLDGRTIVQSHKPSRRSSGRG